MDGVPEAWEEVKNRPGEGGLGVVKKGKRAGKREKRGERSE